VKLEEDKSATKDADLKKSQQVNSSSSDGASEASSAD
jgi:hypothetical protein